jgi:hypothetical protein
MANYVFNIGKGRIAQMIRSGLTLKALMLKTADTDANNRDLTTIAALLAAVNVEANFTNYARVTLTSVVQTVDNSGDAVNADWADIVFTSAGGATNNTTTDLIIYQDPGTGDANCVPVICLDAVFTTNGQNVTLVFDPAGSWSAA